MTAESIPAWAVFALPAVGILLSRGHLANHVIKAAEEFGVPPLRGAQLATRAVVLLAGSFLLIGTIQAIGGVPNPLCVYTFLPLRWPVVATWAVIIGLWTTILLWLWFGREAEVLLLLSGLMPQTSVMVYRVGALVVVFAGLFAMSAFRTEMIPCAWSG